MVVLIAEVGPAASFHPAPPKLIPGTTSSKAFIKRTPIVDNDHTRGRISGRAANQTGLRAIATFPVEHMGDILGVMNFGSMTPAFFTESRVTFLSAVANECAVLLYNARLRDDMERQLRLANDRSEFIAIASHELRTPISVISGFTELLIDSGRHADIELECLSSVLAQAIRLSKTVDDLVNLEWMRSGDQMGNGHAFVLSDLLGQVDALIDADWPNAELQIDWNEDSKIIGDASRLQRVVAAVVDNAFRHSKGTSVTLIGATDDDRSQCRITVRDDGCGFPEGFTTDDIALFRRPSHAKAPTNHGLGLGLFVVKTFLESVGGTLSVTSDPSGTAVEMRFPTVMDAA